MPDPDCNVLLTKEEVRERNKGKPPSQKLQYGDHCNRNTTRFFRIHGPNTGPVLVARCEHHCKNISVGLDRRYVMQLTYEEAMVAEVQDS